MDKVAKFCARSDIYYTPPCEATAGLLTRLYFAHLPTGNPYAYDKSLPNFWRLLLEMSQELVSDEQTVAEGFGEKGRCS